MKSGKSQQNNLLKRTAGKAVLFSKLFCCTVCEMTIWAEHHNKALYAAGYFCYIRILFFHFPL